MSMSEPKYPKLREHVKTRGVPPGLLRRRLKNSDHADLAKQVARRLVDKFGMERLNLSGDVKAQIKARRESK